MNNKLKISDIPNLIQIIVQEGIDVETKIKASELKMIYDMRRFIENTGRHHCSLEDEKIIIETLYYEPLAEVEISKSILHITPVNDEGFFDALISILEYFSNIQEPKKLLKFLKENKYKPKEDDFEWI